jgi:hypothetical protein
MLSIPSRSGRGHDFEFEFIGYLAGVDASIKVPESRNFRSSTYCENWNGDATHIRWTRFAGEHRLVIDIPGAPKIPFDDAPVALRNALTPWLEKFAAQLRRSRIVTDQTSQ